MANRRAIVKRRKAVRNIKKITRTMQLIATARFQAAMNRAVASRPYTDKLAELVADLARVSEELRHPLMEVRPGAGRSALVVLSSNRGLAGGYNAHLLRTVIEHLDGQRAAGVETAVSMVGKKGIAAFRFRGREVAERYVDFDDKPRYEAVEPIARQLTERFLAGEIDSVSVAYMRFYSPGKQTPEVVRLLPIARDELAAAEKGAAEKGTATKGTADPQSAAGERATAGYRPVYEIRPSAEELLDRLLPATVRMRLYQAFLDAAVSEQIYRMTAMKAATEAAEDMIGGLTRQYNRARQTQITLELLDIVGGANALA